MTDYSVLFTWETKHGPLREYLRVISAFNEQDALRRLRDDLTDFVWYARREVQVVPATTLDTAYAKLSGHYLGGENG